MPWQIPPVVQCAFCLLLALSSCSDPNNSPAAPAEAAVPLKQRVEAAIASASDLPQGALTVMVDEGVVVISGSLTCDDCGGSATPGGITTIQQSLGAVVRAVPGVDEVRFELD